MSNPRAKPPKSTNREMRAACRFVRAVSIRARRVDACTPRVDSCTPRVESCAPCVDSCAPCVDSCLRFSCKTMGRPPFGTYRPSPLERIAPHPRPQLPRIAPPPPASTGANRSSAGPVLADSCAHESTRGRDESAARASPRPQPLSQTKNRNPFMSTATITSTDTGQKSPRQTTTQPTTTPTRTLRRQQAPHHHGRRETRVHVAGRSKDARPGAAHDGSPSVDDGDATAGRGLTAPENTKGRQARDGDLLPSRWNHVG